MIGHFEDILTRQLEKIAYWNPIYGSTNKYRSTNEQVDYNTIQTYIIPLINLVTLELREKYGYQDYRLSKEEVNYFIAFASSMSDYQSLAEMISRYRKYAVKPELRKLLEQSSAKADFRIPSILKYLQYYDYPNDGVKIADEYIERVKSDIEKLKSIISSGRFISPNDNPEKYLEMLYSRQSLIGFHNEHQA